MNSPRVDLKPLFAVVTFAIGIGLFWAIDMIRPENAPTAEPAPLVVRPNENTDPIATMKLELSCYDPSIIPIWSALKKDAEFIRWTTEKRGSFSCSDMLDVKVIDLNGDRAAEILVRGKGELLCGVGFDGCGLWVFSLQSGRYKTILSAQDAADTTDLGLIVRKSRTGGYADLLIKIRYNPWDTIYSTFKFDGKEYLEARCVHEVPNHEERSEDSWRIVPCGQEQNITY